MRKALIPENRFGRYFFYAIGEILLVVIGILIALQINNGNETRKKNVLRDNYIDALIADLKKDTIDINNNIINLTFDKIQLANYRTRLSSHNATIDTLIHIFRYEFNPRIKTTRSYNNNTFEALKSTGNIDLLPDWLNKEINELNKLQLDVIGQSISDTEFYRSFVVNLDKTTPSKFMNGIIEKGPLHDSLWENINPLILIEDFNRITSIKHVSGRSTLAGNNLVLLKTNKILNRLVQDR